MSIKKIHSIILCIVLIFMVACGGGGGSSSPSPAPSPSPTPSPSAGPAPVTELSGQFVDSAVTGLKYVTSSGIEGFTESTGVFKYKAGDTVKFYLGDILLGEVTAATFITPVDLVPGAIDETNIVVANIARLLQTLDDDDDPSNGILISSAVFADVASKAIDFTLDESVFDTTYAAIIAELTALRIAGVRTIVSVADAKLHLSGSLLCGRAGAYSGTFSGSVSGSWSFEVSAAGTISGIGSATDGSFGFTGSVTSDGTAAVGSTDTGAVFNGTIALDGSVSGSWVDTGAGESGTFSGSRTSGPSTPCVVTGSDGGSTGGGGPTTGDYGSLSMTGQADFGTAFNPNEIGSLNITASAASILWNDNHLAAGTTDIARTLQAHFFGTGQVSIILAGTRLNSSTGIAETWNYLLSCLTAGGECAGVSHNPDTRQVSFTDVVVKPSSISPGSATNNVTLNGTLTYPAPAP